MPKRKLLKVNSRMLEWMEYAVESGKARNQQDWCNKISFPYFNISHLKAGKQSFTVNQIENAARLINGNINWLYGIEPNFLLDSKKKTAIQMLKEATRAVEIELKK